MKKWEKEREGDGWSLRKYEEIGTCNHGKVTEVRGKGEDEGSGGGDRWKKKWEGRVVPKRGKRGVEVRGDGWYLRKYEEIGACNQDKVTEVRRRVKMEEEIGGKENGKGGWDLKWG